MSSKSSKNKIAYKLFAYQISLPLLPGPLLPGVRVTVKVPFLGQVNLFKHYSYLI